MNSRTYLAMLLALFLPGAGHFYLGRRGRAVCFFLIVVFMFVVGLAIDGKLYVPIQGQPLTLLASLASMGTGVPYFVARLIGPFTGDARSFTFEYGTAFSLSAGLMNLLLVLDAFDIAEGRKA